MEFFLLLSTSGFVLGGSHGIMDERIEAVSHNRSNVNLSSKLRTTSIHVELDW